MRPPPAPSLLSRPRGVKVAMLTGDNRATAERIGRELGVDIVLAEVLPDQKADQVKALQAKGKTLGMVGDGINDAPALTRPTLGLPLVRALMLQWKVRTSC